ncbi:hypothetical protein AAC387_Pa08g0112 [Persea americana]
MDGIYDELLRKWKIQPLAPKKPEEVGRVHDSKYCRYHQIVEHPTNACNTLRNVIKYLADNRVLTFMEEGSLHAMNTVYLTSEKGIPYRTVTVGREVSRPQHVTCKHCHVTSAQIIEQENTLGQKVHHTHSGKDFAKDYSKNRATQVGQSQDKEAVPPQKEDFLYDIINHLLRVPTKVSMLDLIKMDKSVRASLLEILTERKYESKRASLGCLVTQLEESILITFDQEDMLLGDCKHGKPIYYMGYIQEAKVSKILTDLGSTVNILLIQTMNHVDLMPRSLKETNACEDPWIR